MDREDSKHLHADRPQVAAAVTSHGDDIVTIYDDLRRAAQNLLRNEPTGLGGHATTLVHDAFLHMAEHPVGPCQNRRHFFNLCVLRMRRILIDRAKARTARKRGGGRAHLDVNEVDIPLLHDVVASDLELLEDAFATLEKTEPLAAEIAQLRWIGGLTLEQAALVTGISKDQASREWRFGRAQLERLIERSR